MDFQTVDLTAILPEMGLLALTIIVVLVDLFARERTALMQWLTVAGLLAVMALAVGLTGGGSGAFNGMIARDGTAVFMKVLLAGVALLAVLMSRDYFSFASSSVHQFEGSEGEVENNPPQPPPSIEGGVRRSSTSRETGVGVGESGIRHGEYYALILLATLGMMVLATASNLITLFLGVETMSLALYVLAGMRTERARSSEAALKYFLLGAFMTGFLLYGMALVYGSTGGKTNLYDIVGAIRGMGDKLPPHLIIGAGLIMTGLLFKVAAAPFHFWSPDVYQGAPTPVTAFMSAGPKAAAFAAFIRLFGWALPDMSAWWGPALWVVAAATMTAGNFIALAQKDIKRMLAYSSIAHAGYLLLAVLAAGSGFKEEALSGMLFYLTAYYLMNIGAFTVAMAMSRAKGGSSYSIEGYHGLAAAHPWMAAALALFLVSLAGIPPTAGFFGKLFVFSAAVKAGFVVLVVIAVLNSVVSVYYYLRIVVYMYMRTGEQPARLGVRPAIAIVLIVCALGVVKYGILPGDLYGWAKKSAAEVVNPMP